MNKGLPLPKNMSYLPDLEEISGSLKMTKLAISAIHYFALNYFFFCLQFFFNFLYLIF